jgi:biopolymer transport protein ExbD
VLLIFYILTTSYTQLQARINHPSVAPDTDDKLPMVTQEQIDKQMIRVSVKLDKGKPIIRIEDKVVEERQLAGEFQRFKKGANKTTILLVFDGDVTNGTLTTIEDAAASAGIQHVNWGVK